MPSLKHFHTYEEVFDKKLGRNDRMRCIHPDCTHYTTRALLRGKRASCPYCALPFVLTPELLRLQKPHCSNCTSETRSKALRKADTLEEPVSTLEEILDNDTLLKNIDKVLGNKI